MLDLIITHIENNLSVSFETRAKLKWPAIYHDDEPAIWLRQHDGIIFIDGADNSKGYWPAEVELADPDCLDKLLFLIQNTLSLETETGDP